MPPPIARPDASPASVPSPPPDRRRALGVVTAGVITFLNLYAVQSLMPLIAAEFGVSLPATGWTITAGLLAVALVAPFVGSVSDMLGRKRLMVAAAWVLVVPTVLAALAPTFGLLVWWRFVQGLLLPFIFAVAVAYIGDEAPGAAGIRLTGLYSMGAITGGFSGRLIAGFVAQAAGWRAAFLVLAALSVGAAALLGAMLPAEQHFTPVRGLRATLRGFAEHLRNRRLLATYAVGFAVLFSIVSAFTYGNFVLAAPPYRLGPAALGAVFVVYLLGLVTTPLASRLAIAIGRRATCALATLAGCAGMALTLVPHLAAVIAGLGVLAGAVFVEQALSLGFIAVSASRAKSTAVGLYVTCYYIGGSLGGILPGPLWRHVGWPGCVGLTIAVQLAVGAITLLAWRDRPAGGGLPTPGPAPILRPPEPKREGLSPS
jgi:predicted MFS family arabinose efflux permease